jgi:LPXTG-motif cell wall-anchored protein
MGDVLTRPRRRAAAGIAAVAVGGAGLLAALATPASAHEGTEPEKPKGDFDCPAIAERYDLDVDWTQFVIEGFPEEEGEHSYTISDRGTPDDTSDDAVITLDVTGPKNFDWTSNVGIDAIAVAGEDTENYATHIYYYEGDELTEDIDYSSAPYSEPHTNPIATITLCWDDEHQPPDTTTTTEGTTTTTAPPDTTTTSAPPDSTSSSSSAPSTAPSSTTMPSTTTTTGEELPDTGSNSTMMLAGLGAALLAVGAGLVFGTRRFWHRNA